MTTTRSSDVAVWEEILYRLERDLDHSEASLHEVPPSAFHPPTEVPPLPQELLSRAQEVLQRQKRLEATLGAALRENIQQRRPPRRGRPSPPRRPARRTSTSVHDHHHLVPG